MADKQSPNAKNSSLAVSILEKVIEVMKRKLEREGVCDQCLQECGCPEVSAQELGVITKFLENNGFKVDPLKGGDALDDLITETERRTSLPPLADPLQMLN